MYCEIDALLQNWCNSAAATKVLSVFQKCLFQRSCEGEGGAELAGGKRFGGGSLVVESPECSILSPRTAVSIGLHFLD